MKKMKKITVIAICLLSGFILQVSANTHTTYYKAQNLSHSFTLTNKNTLQESDYSVSYPCSHGGTPLVIYGVSLNHKGKIYSKGTIMPLYVAPGMKATALQIAFISQTPQASETSLDTLSENPGSGGLKFSLKNIYGNPFYVNTVSGAVTMHDKTHWILTDETAYSEQAKVASSYDTPNYNFAQDNSMDIDSSLRQFTFTETAWNELTPWHSSAGTPPPKSLVSYRFSPESSDIPNDYNGYGLWVCGKPAS